MLDEYCIKKIDESKFQGSTEEETRQMIANQKDIARVRLQNERIKMSRQWDEIESCLRTDDFWYFLAEESDEYDNTRIDFIFDISLLMLLMSYMNFLLFIIIEISFIFFLLETDAEMGLVMFILFILFI